MPSSSGRPFLPVAALAILFTWTARVDAQQAQGFALDRLYPSAPGGGWFVMDTLDLHGGLGGAVSLTTDYAHDPLRVGGADGTQRLAVVSDEALADFGFAATYDRWRLYLNLVMPLDVAGNGGTVGGYQFTAPTSSQSFTPSGVNPSTTPDAYADARLGVDVRLLGTDRSPFRLGAGAQLFIPSPNTPQSEYLSDGTFRAMARVLFAGDVRWFSYAGQVGVHVRPLDYAPIPGSPQGSELLFGAAAGWRTVLGQGEALALVVGPEVFGETAFRSPFGTNTTGVEGLLAGRIEGTADDGPQIRVKLGAGGGLDANFGAPEWRLLLGIELFDHHSDRDGDGVSDHKDACPTTPGVKTTDSTTNGCPPGAGQATVPDSAAAAPVGPGVVPEASPP
jgi:OOP family OmpA-OmpF porin